MSLTKHVANNARRAALLGADIPTVAVVASAATAHKEPVKASIAYPACITGQVATPGTGFPTPAAFFEHAGALVKNTNQMKLLDTSTDGRIQLFKRDTANEAYGVVSNVVENGRIKLTFLHYPVHFMDEEVLNKFITEWAGKETPEMTLGDLHIKTVRFQFEGLLVKVFADDSGTLRFATKKKAQLCKEHEEILLETLAQNHAEMAGMADLKVARASVLASLMAYTHQGIALTFRLVHPAVSYVNGPLDLSKNSPKAMLVQWGDKHIDAQRELPLQGVFTTPDDVYDACEMSSFGAVMAELFNPETGLTHYAKLVSQRRHQHLLAVEGINGNFRAFVARLADKHTVPSEFEGQMTKLKHALNPCHLPALEEAFAQMALGMNDGCKVVAAFLERNRTALCNEKSALTAALFKMDCKLAKNLVGAAGMFNPRRGDALTFVKGMRLTVLEGHIKLLTQIVEKKLTHTNTGVADAARLCTEALKACMC